MTLTLGIATKDRIVVAADGKVQDTEKGILNKEKIFKLSDSCVATLSGMGLKDIDEFVVALQTKVKSQDLVGVAAIAEYVRDFASERMWADSEDVNKSHLVMLILGYEGREPFVYVLLSSGELEPTVLKRFAVGSWDAARDLMASVMKRKDFSKVSTKAAEKLAVEMLAKGEEANPQEIGGQGMLWHVRPHKVEKKSSVYLAKLQSRYIK